MAFFEIIKLHVAYTTADDRGSLGGVIGYFKTAGAASYAAQGRGYYAGDGRVVTRSAIAVDGRFYVLAEGSDEGYALAELDIDLISRREDAVEAAKRKAMAALSAEERKAIGLEF